MASIKRRLLRSLGACALASQLIAAPAAASEGGKPKSVNAATIGEEGIVGEWWSESKEGRIRFYKHRDGTFRGILAWSKKPRADTENDNPKLRSRSIIGIVLMWKLRYEDGEYEDGYVYNPEDGNVYRVDVKVLGRDKLEVRGYLGISLLGQTEVWTRYR
jgi:uncharacterized protein (DUF2147 family)